MFAYAGVPTAGGRGRCGAVGGRGGGGGGEGGTVPAVGDHRAAVVVRQAEEHELGIRHVDVPRDRVAAADLASTLLGRTQVGDVGAGVEIQVRVVGIRRNRDADRH